MEGSNDIIRVLGYNLLIRPRVQLYLYIFFAQFNNVRLNLINHVLALFHDKFACNTALRNLVFRWESCKGSV